MIRPEALTRLRLLVGAVRQPLIAGELDRELPPLQPGQPIDGRVEQQTRTGFIVAVNGRSFEIKLPDGAKTGDLLRMVYVNDNPRPTFALLRVEADAVRPESRLSDTGKLLAMLREPAASAAGELATDESVPIFQSRIPDTTQAASLLRESLAMSGLFYESHQAQWVLGARTIAQLQREPQGKLAPLPPAEPEAKAQTISIATEPAAVRPPNPAAGAAALIDAQEPAEARQPLHSQVSAETFPIVRQQLNALESGPVEWRGMVWPGQVMEWRVSEGLGQADERDADANEPEDVARTWRTELRLTLPNIGRVVARIELDAAGARLRILADSDQHARRLREEATSLAARFGASGITVNALEVANEPETA